MSIKGLVLITMFSIVFLLGLTTGGSMDERYEIVFLVVIILAIVYEIYDRRKNLKVRTSKFDEKILVRKGTDYYLNMAIIMPIININKIISLFSVQESKLYENKITPMTIIIMGILFIFYGYFYVSSNQILYKDGLKLSDNRFIGKDDIEEVCYRCSIITNTRIIEINTKKTAEIFRKKIKIRCENEKEFLTVIEVLDQITGVQAVSLEC